jgi:Lipocalin-like domain
LRDKWHEKNCRSCPNPHKPYGFGLDFRETKLVSYENRSGDQVTYHLGKNPVGYIMYNNGGYMAATLMASNRRSFSSMDIMGGTTEEIVAAYGTYISYCGK